MVELLVRYRDRLRRMVTLRFDPRLRGRVDASDVIQDGYLDAMRRLDEFIQNPAVSHMSNVDAATVLGLGPAAASKRYTRAVGCIGAILAELPGGVDGALKTAPDDAEGFRRTVRWDLGAWLGQVHKPLRFIDQGDWHNRLAFSPDGRSFATSYLPYTHSNAASIDLWDTASGRKLSTFPRCFRPVRLPT